jgi:16S rRNA (adenine1518-N6/adenine1519-N6)-dimethyltransferase
MPHPLPPLRDVIARYDLRPKKGLGQHFLFDTNLTDAIAAHAGDLTGHTVIEIGPGPGGLTRSLLATNAARVIAIEKDQRCLPALEELHAHSDKLQIISGDALQHPTASLGTAPRAIIANLPYNVGTELLLGWLKDIARDPTCYRILILMFQKEVAERIAAPHNTRDYGRISVLAQWLCDIQLVRLIPAAAFTPPPKVESAIVQLIPRATPRFPANKDRLEQILAIAFQQRRKMLRSALKPLGPELIEALPSLGIDSTLRPDQVTIEQYCKMTAY